MMKTRTPVTKTQTPTLEHRYPPWPHGAGHMSNRVLVSWIVDNFNSLKEYQGEDVSFGDWMQVAPFKADMKSSSLFIPHNGKCEDLKKAVIGHNIKPVKMKACFSKDLAAGLVTAANTKKKPSTKLPVRGVGARKL